MSEKKVGKLQKAAGDINEVLKPEPLLDVTAADEAVKAELIELLPSIKAGDKLTDATWATLKDLGWKDTKPAKVEKPAAKKDAKGGKKAKAPKEKKVRAPSTSPYGLAMAEMIKAPDQDREALEKKLEKNGVDLKKGHLGIGTAYSVVRSVVKGLREHGLMK